MDTKARTRLIILVVLASVVLFLAGFLPATLKARKANAEVSACAAELAQMRLERDLARLHGTLGLALYEANRNNFAHAGKRATDFFDGLDRTLSDPAMAADRATGFRPFLDRRDEITADIARAESGVAGKLNTMFVGYDAELGSV